MIHTTAGLEISVPGISRDLAEHYMQPLALGIKCLYMRLAFLIR